MKSLADGDSVQNAYNEDKVIDRRGMIKAAAVTAAGAIAALAAPGVAAAGTGDPVTAGTMSFGTGSNPGLWGCNWATGNGVRGESLAAGTSGVYGVANGTGVTGEGKTGVHGRSTTGGNGVFGETSAADPSMSGVSGLNTGQGYGVLGTGKVGTAGVTDTGTGVLAHAENYGTALRVEGEASFTRSGVTAVGSNKSYVTITVPSLLQVTCKFLVTMQKSAGAGVYVLYAAKTSATTFRVYFSKKTTKTSRIAWMVID